MPLPYFCAILLHYQVRAKEVHSSEKWVRCGHYTAVACKACLSHLCFALSRKLPKIAWLIAACCKLGEIYLQVVFWLAIIESQSSLDLTEKLWTLIIVQECFVPPPSISRYIIAQRHEILFSRAGSRGRANCRQTSSGFFLLIPPRRPLVLSRLFWPSRSSSSCSFLSLAFWSLCPSLLRSFLNHTSSSRSLDTGGMQV